MPPMYQTTTGLFQRQRFIDDAIDVSAAKPLVSELGPAVQVDGCDDPHVGLSPLAATVGYLGFEELQSVQSEVWLGYLERFP